MLVAGIMIGARLWPADGRGWQIVLATVASALIAVVPFLWLYRARLVRRWRAALDAYAEREIARDRRSNSAPLHGERTWR